VGARIKGDGWTARKRNALSQTRRGRYWRFSHGTTWAELCDDLTVVDVPGDHFSLLRQDPPDMEPLVSGQAGCCRRASVGAG
jgi:thioesterase domain-containing protein